MYEHELSEKVSNDGTRTFSPDGHGSDKELEVGHLEPAEATCSMMFLLLSLISKDLTPLTVSAATVHVLSLINHNLI